MENTDFYKNGKHHLDDLSFYDFYFKHGYNEKYKYSYGKIYQFRGYKHYSCYNESDIESNSDVEIEREYIRIRPKPAPQD
jgi:hypothetical protein